MSGMSLYGKSLYELCKSEALEDSVMKSIEMLQSVFSEQEDYIRLLSEPSIAKKERLELLSTALKDSIPEYLLSFLMLLVEKGLISGYKQSFRSYRSHYNHDKGIEVATVYTAVELSEEEKQRLIQALEKRTGKEIQLRMRISDSVIGGIRVELDGESLDGTVESRLRELRRSISSVEV